MPKVFDLRSDPYERADITSNTYYDWVMSDGVTIFMAAQPLVVQFLATFKEYPPSQRASSFSIDQIVEKTEKLLERHTSGTTETGRQRCRPVCYFSSLN